jgi:citrate lyase beta subunit
VRPLVAAKLATEPVEDLRIDFEDGYGVRSDDAEDAHARAAARSVAEALRQGRAPAFVGVRCKSLERPTRHRAIRTLDEFLSALFENGRPLPPGFLITLPKVTSAAQVSAMAALCDRLEQAHGLTGGSGPSGVRGCPPAGTMSPRASTAEHGSLMFEIQVETPQLVLGPDGAATIARCVHAAGDRLFGLHYGTYDYSAALGIAAGYQSMEHPAADHARAVMQVAVAETGLRLSDGSTNVLPVGDRDEVVAAWQLHSRLVRRSLERGFYQGWDLHPAQLVTRYAATYAFFRDGMPTACERLRSYQARAVEGREEPATAKALASYLLRGLNCGAYTEPEIVSLTNLNHAQLQILARRGTLPTESPR